MRIAHNLAVDVLRGAKPPTTALAEELPALTTVTDQTRLKLSGPLLVGTSLEAVRWWCADELAGRDSDTDYAFRSVFAEIARSELPAGFARRVVA